MADPPRFPVDKALALAECLDGARLPHAFGGAIALAYWAEPRGTIDVDINLFVSVERASEVLALLSELGAAAEEPGTLERVHKILFDRPKDWLDVEQMIRTQGHRFERDYCRSWLAEILGPDEPRLARLDDLGRAPE